MKLSLALAAALAVGVPAALALSIPVPPPVKATPVSGDTARGENLGLLCEEGSQGACRELVALTGGNCAAPAGSGCRYDSNRFVPADNGLMVEVPYFGKSRFETVAFCLNESKVDKYQNLITDTQFETFGNCMIENT
jgi:hypothetical protein